MDYLSVGLMVDASGQNLLKIAPSKAMFSFDRNIFVSSLLENKTIIIIIYIYS